MLQLAPQPPLSEGNIPLWSVFVIIYHHHHRHQYMLTYIELYCDVRLFTDCLTVYILYYMYILMIRPSMYCTDVRLSCYNKCILLLLLLLAPCGLRGCKNGPDPFPGRMSYKATKPGLVFVLYLSMFFIVLVFIRAPFYVLLVFIICVMCCLSFGCSS